MATDFVYVTKVMKTVLGIKGRSKWMNERSHQFLKRAEIQHDGRVRNGGNWSLLITEEKADRLESFYRSFLKNALYKELDQVGEVK